MSEVISAIAYGDAGMLESLADMTLNTLAQSALDERVYAMVRIAALVAMDAPAESYAISLSGTDSGVEVEDLEGILITLAPVVGAARIASAASNVMDTFFDEVDIPAEGAVADALIETPTEDLAAVRAFDADTQEIEVVEFGDRSELESHDEIEVVQSEEVAELETV